jgi:hypothetical protein
MYRARLFLPCHWEIHAQVQQLGRTHRSNQRQPLFGTFAEYY